MAKEESPKVYQLKAKYPADAVGRHMSFNFPVVNEDTTVKQALEVIRKEINRFETIVYLFVVDEDKKLLGVVTIKHLFKAPARARLGDIMERKLVKVSPWTSEENVVLLALQHDIKYVPVVDSNGHILGIFTTHALRQFLNRQVGVKLLRASGVQWNEAFSTGYVGIWKSTLARVPWILFGVLGALISGSIIGVYKNTLEALIILAFFIPVVMSTGANVANQSAMIFIRNLMAGNVRSAWRYLWRELIVGVLIGLLISTLLFVIIFLWQASLVIAFAVSASIFMTVIFAAIIGFAIPYLLNKFEIDPAFGSGPFLTTFKDIVSMFIYFSLTTIIIGYLR